MPLDYESRCDAEPVKSGERRASIIYGTIAICAAVTYGIVVLLLCGFRARF